MIKKYWRLCLLILFSATFMTMATNFIQTGSRPFEHARIFATDDGKPCVFKEFGFPFKVEATVEEPCAYGVLDQKQPPGIEVGYEYYNLPAYLYNMVAWAVLFTVIIFLSEKTIHTKRED